VAGVPSAASSVKGLRSLTRRAQNALDCRLRCGCFPGMRKMYFSHVLHEEHDGGDAQAVSVVHRRRGEFTLTQTPAAKHAAPGCGGLPWRIWRRVGEKTPSLSLTA